MARAKGIKPMAQNKKAFHDYFVEERIECGMELHGTEVKSMRQGRMNLKESFAIVKDGEVCKFLREVGHITFSGEYANRKGGQEVYYITERAVFRLTPDGLLLIEIAPGAELKRDILDRMEFEPMIAPDLREMDAALFAE